MPLDAEASYRGVQGDKAPLPGVGVSPSSFILPPRFGGRGLKEVN